MHVNRPPAWIAIGSAAAMALGCLLPWVTVLGQTFAGTDARDGRIILGIAVGLIIITALRFNGLGHWLLDGVAFVGALAAGVLAAHDLIDISRARPSVNGIELGGFTGIRVGAGLWLTVAGAVCAAAACAVLSTREPIGL